MKYAVIAVADQTIVFWGGDGYTTSHAEAMLFDARDDALRCLVDTHGDDLEIVLNEEEFRARPNTW